MSHSRVHTVLVAAAAVLTVGLSACGSGTPAAPPSGSSTGVTGTVNVFAAASLTESFTQIGQDFEAANPGSKVTFNFAGSSALATQIDQGAPADVFAAASPATMKAVTDAGNADGAPAIFVRNQLVIVVAKGNPKGITGLSDLTKPDLKVALCAVEVPCGAAAKKALEEAKVTLKPVTLEQDVKAALSKVKLGEVDAALVYRTDAKAATADVDGIDFPESAARSADGNRELLWCRWGSSHPRIRAVDPAVPAEFGKHPVLVAKDLYCPGVLRLRRRRPIASSDQNDHPVGGVHPHLVRIDSEIETGRLRHLRTKCAVGRDALDCRPARLVVRNQNVAPRNIDGHENRPRRQRNRLSMLLQRSIGRIYAK